MHDARLLDKVAIDLKSRRLLRQLLIENPRLEEIMRKAGSADEALAGVKDWARRFLNENLAAVEYYEGRGRLEDLRWGDYAAIRLLDYVENAGLQLEDLNLRGQIAVSNPIALIWLSIHHGTGGARPAFFEDMLHLFRQLSAGETREQPTRAMVLDWMKRHPSGLDPRMVEMQQANRERIIEKLVESKTRHPGFEFPEGASRGEKIALMRTWWNDSTFHLKFAARSPDRLNALLDDSIDPDTMTILRRAEEAGIPFFVNPYYLSLINTDGPEFAPGADLAIRSYMIYSRELVDEFGHIVAWEKEDEVRPGEPNAAGWLLPTETNVHRRYPDVAILIPDSTGRACAGLCASCQRMYDFQRGHLNFDLDTLRTRKTWPEKLAGLMEYFETDSQLRDILITGGDALMSTDRELAEILDAVCAMAERKREANRKRPDGQKYAELQRLRLGSRLPAYLPQRVTPALADILSKFREKACRAGVKQFVIQTHFDSPMEVTPESREAVRRLAGAGWIVVNQMVFTAAASRRGATSKLRKVLNEIGVLSYYTFSCKGYSENKAAFATNARVVQEQVEEKVIGDVPKELEAELVRLPERPSHILENIRGLTESAGIPFLATDRNVLNLPGVGKSMSYRVIGITRYGRRILEFDHDPGREHSPIVQRMGRVKIIESKSIREYLDQLDEMGEDPAEYESLWGYSIGETEPRCAMYEYPPFEFTVTKRLTHFGLPE